MMIPDCSRFPPPLHRLMTGYDMSFLCSHKGPGFIILKLDTYAFHAQAKRGVLMSWISLQSY